jgi:predicted transcriptional regulator
VKSDILEHIVNTVFKGNRSSLVLQALGNHQVSDEELDAIKNLIEEMEGRNDRNVS